MASNWGSLCSSVRQVIEQNPEVQFGLTAFPSKGQMALVPWGAAEVTRDYRP